MSDIDIIGSFCFKDSNSLIPILLIEEDSVCDEFEPTPKGVSRYCVNCKRFAYVENMLTDIRDEDNKYIIHSAPHKMVAIKGNPVCKSIFDKHNKKVWPNTPKKERIYTKSGKTWCKKTTKESADKLFVLLESMKHKK